MSESDVQQRLDVIETRVTLVLALLTFGYAVAGAALLVQTTDAVTPWHAGVGAVALLAVGSAVGIYRRRRAR